MKVLVVGGAGYIGSHTCKALAAEGFEPVVFDNLSTGYREFVQWGPFIEGDLLDEAALGELFKANDFVGVIHFAAKTYVGESVSAPAKYYRNNVAGTLNLVDAMRANGVDKLVFSSTAAVYGAVKTSPINEDVPKEPINPYGRTKRMMEQIFDDYDTAYGLRSVCLRYFNAAGCDPDGDVGEDHVPETHLIPRALMAVTGEIDDFKVFGDDYPTADGTAVRDYIHVADLAAAHIAALRYLMTGGASERINLGIGAGYSVKEILDAVERVTGKAVPHEMGPRRAGDPPELIANASRARDVLGFEPRYASLDKIVSTAWAWHQNRHAK